MSRARERDGIDRILSSFFSSCTQVDVHEYGTRYVLLDYYNLRATFLLPVVVFTENKNFHLKPSALVYIIDLYKVFQLLQNKVYIYIRFL